MPSRNDLEQRSFRQMGSSALSLAGGILLTVTGLRDFLFYLDSYDLTMVGTTDSLTAVILLVILGSLLLVFGLQGTISLAVTSGSN